MTYNQPTKIKGKTLHKLQISEAIPSTERDEQAVTKVDMSKEGPTLVCTGAS